MPSWLDLRYTANHELLFLGLSMAAGKASADPARDIAHSTVVVAMARNGTEFGIRVSGLGDEWFTAPSPRVKGLYLPGYSERDAGLDMGDSAITETVGWGGFVLAGATGILSFVGGAPEEAIGYSREMRQITVTASTNYRMPILGLRGNAAGDRHPEGSPDRHRPHHRYGDGPQRPRPPDHRRGPPPGSNGVLPEGIEGLRAEIWDGAEIRVSREHAASE